MGTPWNASSPGGFVSKGEPNTTKEWFYPKGVLGREIQGGFLLTSYKWSYINPYKWRSKWGNWGYNPIGILTPHT